MPSTALGPTRNSSKDDQNNTRQTPQGKNSPPDLRIDPKQTGPNCCRSPLRSRSGGVSHGARDEFHFAATAQTPRHGGQADPSVGADRSGLMISSNGIAPHRPLTSGRTNGEFGGKLPVP